MSTTEGASRNGHNDGTQTPFDFRSKVISLYPLFLIAFSYHLFRKKRPNFPPEWAMKFPDFVRRLEEALYRNAQTKVSFIVLISPAFNPSCSLNCFDPRHFAFRGLLESPSQRRTFRFLHTTIWLDKRAIVRIRHVKATLRNNHKGGTLLCKLFLCLCETVLDFNSHLWVLLGTCLFEN
jgi:hypothetical protein